MATKRITTCDRCKELINGSVFWVEVEVPVTNKNNKMWELCRECLDGLNNFLNQKEFLAQLDHEKGERI